MPHQRGFLRRHYSGPVCIQRDRVLRAPRYIYRQLQADSARGVHSRGKGGALYDETNRRPRTTTMPDDHDHGDATRFHFFTSSSSFVRANPFIWNMPDWSLHRIRHLSKASASHSGLDTARIGLATKPRIACIPIPYKNLVTNLSV